MDGITEGWRIKTEKQDGSSAADFDLKYGLRFFFLNMYFTCFAGIPFICFHRFINYLADVWDYKEKFDSVSAKNETSTKVG